jgi:RecA-family ATPase
MTESTLKAPPQGWNKEIDFPAARSVVAGAGKLPTDKAKRAIYLKRIGLEARRFGIGPSMAAKWIVEMHGGTMAGLDGLRSELTEIYQARGGTPGMFSRAYKATDSQKPVNPIIPTPWTSPDPALIAPRAFVYKPYYARKFLSLTSASGGTGKSRLVMTEAIAMATGRALLGIEPTGGRPLNVWVWNGEDPKDEIERGLAAVEIFYKIKAADYVGKLYYDSGRLLPIKIAETENGKTKIATPLVAELIRAIKEYGIDVLFVDPFATTHGATENDNNAMEGVARVWAHIADATNVAIGTVHHVRKTGGFAATIEDSRGGTALANAARVRRAVNKMTPKQAEGGGVEPGRAGFFFSVDTSNSTLMKPASALEWYQLQSIELGNAGIWDDGDSIGVPERFAYIPAKSILEPEGDQPAAIMAAIRERDRWRESDKVADWVGYPIATALGLGDVKGKANKAKRDQVKRLIVTMIEGESLERFEALDDHRERKGYIRAKG